MVLNHFERNKTMNTMNSDHVVSGKYLAHDKQSNPVIIEWQKTTIVSQSYAETMKNLWDLARAAYVSVEMQFLKAYPDVVGKEPYFKLFEPLFTNGLEFVDWTAAEDIMTSMLKNMFVFDPSKFSAEMIEKFSLDVCYCVVVKDAETLKPLGFITIISRPSYPANNVKIMSLAVDPTYQNRGIGKVLMASTFKVVPDTQRIFLCTRVTNQTALQAYRSWGFIVDQNPILDHPFNLAHWTFMEYKASASDGLQKLAEMIK